MQTAATTSTQKRTNVRWYMLFLIMMVMAINFLDRANLSVAAPVMSKELGLGPADMGILFSAFGWMYMMGIPFSGVLLDKFGPRLLMAISLVGWSLFTVFVGMANSLVSLIGCRIGVGLFEAPVIPANVRCVSAWFPTNERALAVGMYVSMQYVALGFLTPALAWILTVFGWSAIFFITGFIGIVAGIIWWIYYRDPQESTIVNEEEINYITNGGGLAGGSEITKIPFSWHNVKHLLSYRQIWGMFIGQFAVNTVLFFFLTWFPSYLISGRGLSILKGGFYAAVPFTVAIAGALLGGKWSDWMSHNGYSHSIARKLPIIVGFALSTVLLGANYTDNLTMIILYMSIAFFGLSISPTVTGALLADVAPKGLVGLTGGMLYFIANVGGTTSPLIIGYTIQATGGYNMALEYVSIIAACGVFAYLFIMGDVQRLNIKN